MIWRIVLAIAGCIGVWTIRYERRRLRANEAKRLRQAAYLRSVMQ